MAAEVRGAAAEEKVEGRVVEAMPMAPMSRGICRLGLARPRLTQRCWKENGRTRSGTLSLSRLALGEEGR